MGRFYDYTILQKKQAELERDIRAAGTKYLNTKHKGDFAAGVVGVRVSDYGYKGPDIQQEAINIVQEDLQRAASEFSQRLDDALRAVGAVDTGELLRSKSVLVTRDGIEVVYDAPYAALIRYGGYIQPYGNPNARPVNVPGRDWVTIAWENMAF